MPILRSSCCHFPFLRELLRGGLFCLCVLFPFSLSAQHNIFVECDEPSSHVQGVAVDMERGYAYFSFTTKLIKTDLQGRIIGSVSGFTCHLGCLDLDRESGLLYASVEYKNDAIGRGILNYKHEESHRENTFYIGIFDTERITRQNMSAETDDVFRAVYLPEVVACYEDSVLTPDGRRLPHRFGCSGIDGLSLGRPFGHPDGKPILFVSMAHYGDTTRMDNDYQLLLQYDPQRLARLARPLDQRQPHHHGLRADRWLWVHTGNTTYGIQNLEFDPATGYWFAAVYPGKKRQWPNYSLFAFDGAARPHKQQLAGHTAISIKGGKRTRAKRGFVLSLAQEGLQDAATATRGWHVPIGSTGVESIGDSLFYISTNGRSKTTGHETCDLRLYRFTGHPDRPFTEVEE